MIRLTLVLLAAIYASMVLWGRDGGSDVEVARNAPLNEPLLVAASGTAGLSSATGGDQKTDDLIEIATDEAVRMALLAGTRPEAQPAASAEVPAPAAEPETPAPSLWYVTGTRVNLRAGPSTREPVLDQAGDGDTAEVLSNPDDEWVRVRMTGTGTEAFIYGRFLQRDPA